MSLQPRRIVQNALYRRKMWLERVHSAISKRVLIFLYGLLSAEEFQLSYHVVAVNIKVPFMIRYSTKDMTSTSFLHIEYRTR